MKFTTQNSSGREAEWENSFNERPAYEIHGDMKQQRYIMETTNNVAFLKHKVSMWGGGWQKVSLEKQASASSQETSYDMVKRLFYSINQYFSRLPFNVPLKTERKVNSEVVAPQPTQPEVLMWENFLKPMVSFTIYASLLSII